VKRIASPSSIHANLHSPRINRDKSSVFRVTESRKENDEKKGAEGSHRAEKNMETGEMKQPVPQLRILATHHKAEDGKEEGEEDGPDQFTRVMHSEKYQAAG
jgi:hypothetical protein